MEFTIAISIDGPIGDGRTLKGELTTTLSTDQIFVNDIPPANPTATDVLRTMRKDAATAADLAVMWNLGGSKFQNSPLPVTGITVDGEAF